MIPPAFGRLPLAFAAALPLALAACSGGKAPPAEDDSAAPVARADCDPTAPSLCGMPFPSTFYMREDASSGTGWRIDLGPKTLPANIDLQQPAPTFWNERDGWSVATPLLAHRGLVSLDGVAGHETIEASLADDSPTVVIDLETGERVAHWCERDLAIEDSDRSLFMCHPAAPWTYGRRYAVGLRRLTDPSGAPLQPSAGFQALRDGGSSGDAEIDAQLDLRRSVYDDTIFPALEAQGWARDELLLAWDFVVGSKEQITGRAVHLRDLSLAWVGQNGVPYTIDEVEAAPNETTAFRVRGHFTAPLYTDVDAPGALLTRDADGMPYENGTTTIPFTVVVPNSVVEAGVPAPVVQYGHGLLGGQGEVQGGYLSEMADRYGWIVFAVDWTGMKDDDVGPISLMLVQDLGRFAIIPERSHQGFVEFHVSMRLVTEHLVADAAFASATVDGGSLIDPTRRYYYGNSQGGILGAAYGAISADVERVALGVGGGPYHLLLTRSHDFEPFFQLFKTMYPDPAHISYWLALIQTLWDEAEGSGYAPAMIADPLPGAPAKTTLSQVAIGDAQVTTLGAQFIARGHGASFIGQPVREAWGIPTVAGPTTSSVYVEWDYGLDEPVVNHPPSADTDPHELPRRERAAQDQIAHFFATGEILDFCEGPCQDLSRFAP
jgi:hypothetical protein